MSPTSTYDLDVLAFAPHPDDVELFCGGVMATLQSLGYRTGIVDLTRGELASQGSVAERAAEADAAASVLGLSLRENLGLPDGFISATADQKQLSAAVSTLRRLRPELVLLPWREERHPDHVAASLLLTRAVFFSGLVKFESPAPPFTPRQVLYYEMRHRMPASFVVDTSAAWERKSEAIACHKSQLARRDAQAATLISSPLALAAIEARDRYRGSEIGVAYGEALYCASTLGVIDPVDFFRGNPFSDAHAFEAAR
jgi:bacillithiol biosynthesis deacetylase BshB1